MRRCSGGRLIQASGCHNVRRRCGTTVRVLYELLSWTETLLQKSVIIPSHPIPSHFTFRSGRCDLKSENPDVGRGMESPMSSPLSL